MKNQCAKIVGMIDKDARHEQIYFDNAATTMPDPRVLDKINGLMYEYGNPHSRTHTFGWRAEQLIDEARLEIANTIGADADDIVFTSGATESNNLAIKGSAMYHQDLGKKHIITVATEHKCVLEACRFLERLGVETTFLKTDKDGIVSIDDIRNAIRDDTFLISVMAVHNEIGVMQDLKAIGALARSHNILFHTDAAQGFGKIHLDVNEMNIDLMSISAHKIYGPKGVGALYIRRKPRVRLVPLISGGGQERGFRSGTLPTMLIVGLGEAARISRLDYDSDSKRIKELHERFKKSMLLLESVTLNGHPTKRYYGIMNFSFAFIEGESLIMSINQLAVSSGSACTSDSLEPSYVLQALGIRSDLAHSSIRFSIGRFTTSNEIDIAIKAINIGVQRLREMSPLWEMFQNGVDIDSIQWTEH